MDATEAVAVMRETVARLAKVEERLAEVLARLNNPAPEPLRVSVARAAVLLGRSRCEVYRYVARGLLVPLPRDREKGRNTRAFFDPANVAAMARGEEHAKEWVAGRKFVPHGRRAK